MVRLAISFLCGALVVFLIDTWWQYNRREIRPAYVVKDPYATVKVTTRLYNVKECTFDKAEDWWSQKGWEAEVHLGPLDWHRGAVPKRMDMVFNGLEEGWAVDVYDQKPDTDWPPSHVWIGNKPTNSFGLELPNSNQVYKWKCTMYRLTKEADINFYPDREVTVDFVWRHQAVRDLLKK